MKENSNKNNNNNNNSNIINKIVNKWHDEKKNVNYTLLNSALHCLKSVYGSLALGVLS